MLVSQVQHQMQRLRLPAVGGVACSVGPLPLAPLCVSRRDRFAGNFQQDAHEFLSDVINVLHDEMQPRLDAACSLLPTPPPLVVVDAGGDNGSVNVTQAPDDGRSDHKGQVSMASFLHVDGQDGDGAGERRRSDPCPADIDLCGSDDGHASPVGTGARTATTDAALAQSRRPCRDSSATSTRANREEVGDCDGEVGAVDGGSTKGSDRVTVAGDRCGEFPVSDGSGGATCVGRAGKEHLMPTTRHFHAEVEVRGVGVFVVWSWHDALA